MTLCSSDDFDWELVVPRIVNPTKIAIIELLRRERRPLSASRMKPFLDDPGITVGRLIYHCGTLHKAGVLEVVSAPPNSASNETFYCLSPQE